MGTSQVLDSPRLVGEAVTLPLTALYVNPANQNRHSEEDIKSMASSIKTIGLIYPLVVQPDAETEGLYRISAGECRFRAMKKLKYESAPCIVLSAEDADQGEVVRVVENLRRRSLKPLEEAAAVRGLLDLGLETEAVARSLGQKRSWVSRRASLTELSERWLIEINNSESKISNWPPSHLEVISRFPTEVQDRILEQCRESLQWRMPTFNDLVAITGQFLHVLAAAPWELDDEALCPQAGACTVCPKRSSHAPDLFEGELAPENGKTPPGDRCLDSECWNRKAHMFLSRKVEELRREHPDLILLNNNDEDGEDLEQAFQAPVLYAPEVTPTRKSDGQAVPALIVNGPGLGRVKWVQRVHENRSYGGKVEQQAEDSPAPRTEKSADEKRQPYDKRRRQVVIDAVRAKIETLANIESIAESAGAEGGRALTERGLVVKTLLLLHLLLTKTGWRNHASDLLPEIPEKLAWDFLSTLRNHQLGVEECREFVYETCWALLRHCLRTLFVRLVVLPGERTNDDHYANAELVCSLLGYDLGALRSKAAVTIPYAKLWREEIVDEWADPEGNKADESEETTASGNGSESQ